MIKHHKDKYVVTALVTVTATMEVEASNPVNAGNLALMTPGWDFSEAEVQSVMIQSVTPTGTVLSLVDRLAAHKAQRASEVSPPAISHGAPADESNPAP